MELIRYLLLPLLGAAVLAFALRRRQRRRAQLRGTLRAEAAVVEVVSELWPVPGESGETYRVRARFSLPDGRCVEALSRNTVHAPGDYPRGSRETVAYRPEDPETFWILRDREYSDLMFMCFGAILLLLGIVLPLAGWMR